MATKISGCSTNTPSKVDVHPMPSVTVKEYVPTGILVRSSSSLVNVPRSAHANDNGAVPDTVTLIEPSVPPLHFTSTTVGSAIDG